MNGALQVTVVGSSPAIPRAGRSCSAYLVESAGTRFAVDFGTGAFASLRCVMPPDDLDAIVITHMHADHFIDLVPLRYALRYGTRATGRRVPLYLPPGGEAMLRVLTSAFAREPAGDFLSEAFDLRTYDPEAALVLGAGTLRFAPTKHYIPTFAARYDAGGLSVTYSSDTAPSERVVELARATTLFICEATLLDDAVPSGERGHSTAREAGAMAAAAGAERLALSHWPAETTPDELRRLAAASYAGPIDVADDRTRFALSSVLGERGRARERELDQ